MTLHCSRRTLLPLLLILAVYGGFNCDGGPPERSVQEMGVAPSIDPDYTSVTIPPNCAPLNFAIGNTGTHFKVVIRGPHGPAITGKSRRPEVTIPIVKWRALLDANRGERLHVAVAVKTADGLWKRYAPIYNYVATEPIDRYLVYRLMPPVYTTSGRMGIYQRDLATFREKPLWLSRMTNHNCMNCHTFKNNDPDYMVAHMRVGPGNGTFVMHEGRPFKVNTVTGLTGATGNPAWHPDGNLIAFSINKVRQFFHATGSTREGIDRVSDIVLYDIAKNMITSTPAVASPDFMETQPEWSPDGKYLYFCRAPQFHFDSTPDCQERIFYDLVRIRYHADSSSWGDIETILPHEQSGGSVAYPHISPDGRFVLFALAPWGTFTIFRPGGDICLLDLRDRSFKKCAVNSDQPESFPVWSSNGRWFVFAGKAMDGINARFYFSHIDSAGNASKPVLLPQKDPRFYRSFLYTYNVPALITKPAAVSPRKLVATLCDNTHIRNAVLDPAVKEWKTEARDAGSGLTEVPGWTPQITH
ncbi:MAG: PD40 domain-containing protein [Chitinispirillaceae bacterium]|nr:PD40 domain-containing protein [Chitinispirillaceae bacterium]